MSIEKIFSRLFLVQISLILSFLCAEGVFRFLVDSSEKPKTLYDLTLGLVHRPYVSFVNDPTPEGINSLGYGGVLPTKAKNKGEKRIFILGGSTVFGNDSQYVDKDHIPFFIKKYLQERYGSNLKVFNYGVPGSVANQDLIRLINDVVNFSPDLVISYGGGNDILGNRRVGYPHIYDVIEMNPLILQSIGSYEIYPIVMLNSELISYFFKEELREKIWEQKKGIHFNDSDLPFYNNHVSNYLESLSRMNKVSKAFGSKFLAFFQPLKGYYYDDIRYKNIEGTPYRKALELFREEINSTSKDYNFIDLSMELTGFSEGHWKDDIHVSKEVNKKIAYRMAQEIEKELSLEKAGTSVQP